jgi:hypothetical protein
MSTPLPPAIRNRIVRHVRVRAGDLVPHELNPRRHPNAQREALAALYAEVGFARSLLAFALPDGRLKLIDGHLRQQLDPDMEVEVEVLDVSEEEARKLLLSLDPLVALAENDATTLDQLRGLCETSSDALANLWRSIDAAAAMHEEMEDEIRRKPAPPPAVPEQYFVLVECDDEATQLALLERFQREGLSCRALLS